MKRVCFAAVCVMIFACPAFSADLNAVMAKVSARDVNALFELGRMYFEGEGIAQSYIRAEDCYIQSATKGHTEAQYNLGMMYFRGIGINETWTKAREWLLKAADNGHTEAQYYIGCMYEYGFGGPYKADEKDKARNYYTKAADKGYAKAQYALGMLYKDGKGGSRDYKKAEELLLKAAEQGYALAQLQLGFMYKDGKITDADYGKAVKWFLKAAEPRHFDEKKYLEAIYDFLGNWKLRGFTKTDVQKKARDMFTLHAEMTQASALFRAGEMYEEGLGVNVDYRKAIELYEQAASLEHGYGGASDAKKHIDKLRASNNAPAKSAPKKNTSGTSSAKPAVPAKTYTPPAKPAAPAKTYTPPAKPAVPAKTYTPPAAPSKQQNITPQRKTAPVFTNNIPKNKPRMAVLDFEDKSEERKANPDAIMNMMVTELHKTGGFTLLERERINDISKEINLGQSGLVDISTAVKIGKLKGAQYVMTGAITLYYYSEKASGFVFPILGAETKAKTAYVVIDIRIIDVETGEIVYAYDKTGQSTQKTRKASTIIVKDSEKMIGGLLDTATRDSVKKHVSAIRSLLL